MVFAPEDATDACRVLALLSDCTTRATAALALGPAGLITRVLAPKFGAFLTFAARTAGAESASGQPAIDELLNRYRFHAIGAGHVRLRRRRLACRAFARPRDA